MRLAKVIGKVVSTHKSNKIKGSNLLLVISLGPNNVLIPEKTYVAMDIVGAGMGDIVLIDQNYSWEYQEQKTAILTVVAIAEEVIWTNESNR